MNCGPFIRNRPERGLNDFPLFPIYDNYQSTGVPFDSLVDALHHGCYNCRRVDHKRKQCPEKEIKLVCHNCGRLSAIISDCSRCKRPQARGRYTAYKRQMGSLARPIWELYPKLFAKPPYGGKTTQMNLIPQCMTTTTMSPKLMKLA